MAMYLEWMEGSRGHHLYSSRSWNSSWFNLVTDSVWWAKISFTTHVFINGSLVSCGLYATLHVEKAILMLGYAHTRKLRSSHFQRSLCMKDPDPLQFQWTELRSIVSSRLSLAIGGAGSCSHDTGTKMRPRFGHLTVALVYYWCTSHFTFIEPIYRCWINKNTLQSWVYVVT